LGLKACNPNEAEMPVKDKIQHEQPLPSILLQAITVLRLEMSRRFANSCEGTPELTGEGTIFNKVTLVLFDLF
jgi:hypothetical protein